MKVCNDIVIFPQGEGTTVHFFAPFANYKYFLLYGPNERAKAKFVNLYKKTVDEKAIFWNKENLFDSIGKEIEIIPSVFNQIMKLEKEFLQVLITSYDPVILASTNGKTLSARTRLLNSISKDMDDRNRKVAFMFDYLDSEIEALDPMDRKLAKEAQSSYNWPNEGEFKFYDRIIYAFESCAETGLGIKEEDYETVISTTLIKRDKR